MSDGAIFELVTEFESGQFPSLHHRKEGNCRDSSRLTSYKQPLSEITWTGASTGGESQVPSTPLEPPRGR
jgi:hypothetical protein